MAESFNRLTVNWKPVLPVSNSETAPTSSACVDGIVSVVNCCVIIFTLQFLDKSRDLVTKATGELIVYLQQKANN